MARPRVSKAKKRKPVRKASNKLDKMTLKQLLALQADVEAAIATARQAERAEVLIRMEKIAKESGFSIGELVGGRGRAKGKVSVAKYANPADRSQTWTGRGRKPNWLVAKLKRGSKMAEFAI